MNKKIPTKTVAKLIDNVEELKSLKDVINYIKDNSSGRDIDILAVKGFIDTLLPDGNLQEFVRKLVTKDLKLGISEKTVNKVFGNNAIPEFGVMLAESYSKKSDKINGKFYITTKLDGNRCAVTKEDGVVKFFSRKDSLMVSFYLSIKTI
jgi:DNA ligase-1